MHAHTAAAEDYVYETTSFENVIFILDYIAFLNSSIEVREDNSIQNFPKRIRIERKHSDLVIFDITKLNNSRC